MSKNQGRVPYSSNVDTALLELLTSIITSENHVQLLQIIDNGSLSKVLTAWSYFASTNNHSQFIDLSSKLSKATYTINLITHNEVQEPAALALQLQYLAAKPKIIAFYTDIINNHLKVVYRALNNVKPSLTIPTLRILTNLVKFDLSPSLTSLFYNSFDFTLAILPKLLVPSKHDLEDPKLRSHMSIRYNFINFWIALNSKVAHYLRKDLLVNNYKIMNTLWKYINDFDSETTISSIIDFIESSILNEPQFKKSSKCRILNENFMYKVQPIFNRLGNDEFATKFILFMNTLVSDSKHGLVFPNDKLWQTNSQSGVPVQINNKTYRINNKLIYTLLTTLKPWESHTQLQFAVTTLQFNPELIPPYMSWMIQHGGGYHDPSLTSWWIGHTLLYTHILQLPNPVSMNHTDFISQDISYDVSLVAESISLPPITKSALTKGLETNKPILTQFTLQLIMFTLKKLTTTLQSGAIAKRQELIESVFNNLPDISAYVQVFANDSTKNPDHKLIKVSLINIINQYEILYPKHSPTSSSSSMLTKFTNSGINDIINSKLDTSSGFELTLLDNYLSIQSHQEQATDLKWWNKSPSGNSLFTSLVKLSANENINDSFTFKIVNLLETLTSAKLLFNKNLIVSPILALIYSFDSSSSDSTLVWNLLDEAVARAIRTPYKYLDLSHQHYNDTSLFVVVLFEQINFALAKQSDITVPLSWLFKFAKYLIVVGEPKESIIQLFNEYLKDPKVKESIEKNNLFEVLEFNSSDSTKDTFLSYIINTSNREMASNISSLEKKPVLSNIDMAALLYRLSLIISDSSIKKPEDLLIEMVSKLGNYLLSILPNDEHALKFVLSSKFWSTFLFSLTDIPSPSKLLVGSLFEEVLQQLPSEIFDSKYIQFNELNKFINGVFQSDIKVGQEVQLFYTKFAWLLTNDQVKQLLNEKFAHNEYFYIRVSQIALERLIKIPSETFNTLLSFSKQETKAILSSLIEADLVTFDEVTILDEISRILETKSNHFLLKSFITSSNTNRDKIITFLVEKASALDDEYLLCYIGYSITLNLKEGKINSEDPILDQFFQRISKLALKFLSQPDFESHIEWNQILAVLTISLSYISAEEKATIIEQVFNYIESKGIKSSFVSEFSQFINHYIVTSEDLNQNIKSWIHKSMLYITKKFAESSTLSKNFDNFLDGIQQIAIKLPQLNLSIWKLVPISIINTQLEVLLNHSQWISNANYLTYSNIVIITGLKNIVPFEKLIQIFINNDQNILNQLPTLATSKARYLSALTLSNLFNFDPSKNSTTILMEKIILLYLGSVRSEDILLKSILIKIESHTSASWVAKVSNWEFTEEMTNNEIELVGEDRLILKDKSNFIISLSKQFIKNSIKSGYDAKLFEVPQFTTSDTKVNIVWPKIEDFYETNKILVNQEYQSTIYDSEFLTMLIINNDELVKYDQKDEKDPSISKAKFDLQKLIESNLLQLIVVNLANPIKNVRDISQVLVAGILNSIDDVENFKDKNIYKVYLSNILHTLRTSDDIPSIVWHIYSSFIPILSNPGHFLYEKSFRYVLSNPTIKNNDIPLYTNIILSMTSDSQSENDESYYRQVAWLLENIIDGTSTIKDLDILKFKGIFEWVLNLSNSPFVTMKVKSLILKLLYIVQSIDQGSDMLITRFGVLTSLEQLLNRIDLGKGNVFDEQLKLNLDQVVIRFGLSVGGTKRIRDWCGDDLGGYIKRIHTSTK